MLVAQDNQSNVEMSSTFYPTEHLCFDQDLGEPDNAVDFVDNMTGESTREVRYCSKVPHVYLFNGTERNNFLYVYIYVFSESMHRANILLTD